MPIPLRLLLVEDNETDAALAAYYLERHGFALTTRRVTSALEFTAALGSGEWDAVLADYALPGFSAPEALALLHASGHDLPFIILSGVIDEERAVTSLRAGAHDFVTKANHARLGPALERELRAAADRRAADAALRQQTPGFQLLFQDNPLPMWVYDPGSLRFLEVNQAAIEHYGYTRAEWLALTLRDIRPPEDQDRLSANLRRIRGQPDRSGPWTHLKKNGDRIEVEIIANDTRFKGRPARLVLALDLTERRRAEAALVESETRFRQVWETTSDALALSDADGTVLAANPAYLALYGFPAEQVIGHNFAAIFPDDARERARANYGEVFASDAPQPIFEARVRRTDGSERIVEARASFLTAGGQRTAMLSTIRDITDRHQAEAALRESEDRFRDLVENSRDLICTHDLDGRILTVNPWAAQTLGYTRAAIEGRPLSQFLAPESAARLPAYLRTIGRRGAVQAVMRVRTAAGEDRVWEFHSTLRTLGVSQPIVRGMAHDVTDRMRLEEALRRSEARYRHLIDNLPGGTITVYDQDLRLTLLGGQEFTQTGLPPDTWRGHTLAEFAPPASLPLVEPHIRAALAGEARNYEVPWNDQWYAVSAAPLRDPGGLIAEAQVVAMNITERKRAEAQIKRQVAYLTALREIDRAISGSLDPRLSLTLLLTHTTDELGVDAAAVWVFRPETHTLERLVERGLRPRAPSLSTQRMGEGPVGRAALERRPVHLPDLSTPDEPSRLAEAALAEGLASLHALPLIAKGEVRGVLEVYQRPPAPGTPDPEWLDFLHALAGQAAIALDNALLFNGLQRANVDLTAAFDSLLESLVLALDQRGGQPAGHSRRVADLAEDLGRALGLAGAELHHARRGALLHDLGHLGVPERILLKPGPLTGDEWVLVRAAPTVARDLLAPISLLRPAVAAPYAQHEHWDGGGYPHGLIGEQIPQIARLCALASAWEALRADRPYRPAFGAAQAREHLQAQAGRQFDPQVVRAFMELRT